VCGKLVVLCRALQGAETAVCKLNGMAFSTHFNIGRRINGILDCQRVFFAEFCNHSKKQKGMVFEF